MSGLPQRVHRVVPGNLLFARNTYYRVLLNYYAKKNRLLDGGYGRWDLILRVDPGQIGSVTHTDDELDYSHGYLDVGAFDIVRRSGAVVGGEWDQKAVPFDEFYAFRSLERRFLRGVGWEDTRYYDHSLDQIAAGNRIWGCTSELELKRHCAQLDALFHSILENGYKSQLELGKLPVAEVTVNVGRDGSLLFNDGRHRLAIAKVLGLREIPVRVLVVHEAFAREHGIGQRGGPKLASVLDRSVPPCSRTGRWHARAVSEGTGERPRETRPKESASATRE